MNRSSLKSPTFSSCGRASHPVSPVRRRLLWGILCLTGLCALLFLILVLTVSASIVKLTSPQVVDAQSLPSEQAYDCILVLGAGVRSDGTPSHVLYDRICTSIEVYNTLKEVPLLMSGDHTGDYNEVGVMKELAVEKGVPSEDVFLDHEGYSTYESLYRAQAVFGAKRVVIITQTYHLHRALYIARELGLEAVGVSADLRAYRKQSLYDLREQLARFKDFIIAARGTYTAPLPPAVDLHGNGDLT